MSSMHESAIPQDLVPSSQGDTKRVVLVADDYPENRRLLYFYLRGQYEVLQAATAEEAIEVMHDTSVDLVIMDLNFCDGMSGIDAIRVIRDDAAINDVRVLALTAYAYPDDRQRCLEAGFDDYISKPVFKNDLLNKLSTMLGSSNSGDGAGPASPDSVWISRPDMEE
ncbi:MAG: response regulator [Rubricoccaceae bacterium]|nr:response regulator [Rubricoccaceae bacterium]